MEETQALDALSPWAKPAGGKGRRLWKKSRPRKSDGRLITISTKGQADMVIVRFPLPARTIPKKSRARKGNIYQVEGERVVAGYFPRYFLAQAA